MLLISIVILSCYLVHQTSIIITFILKFKLWVDNSMSILLMKHVLFFPEMCVYCKVLILNLILLCYVMLQMSINIIFGLEFKLWVLNSMLVFLYIINNWLIYTDLYKSSVCVLVSCHFFYQIVNISWNKWFISLAKLSTTNNKHETK